MKKIIISLGMLVILAINSLQAQKIEPQWKIYLAFEDGTGQKDTVWLGYDPLATYGQNPDTIFGERWEYLDTSKFNVYVEYDPPSNKAIKSRIFPTNLFVHMNLYVTKGKLPVTMKWEKNKLNSENLPNYLYPNIPNRPKARIDVYQLGVLLDIQIPDCPFSFDMIPQMILTDYESEDFYSMCHCIKYDSVYFSETENYSELGETVKYPESLKFGVNPYNYEPDIVDIVETDISLYPNPVSNILTINNKNNKKLLVNIYDIHGSLILNDKVYDHTTNIDMSNFIKGLYLIKIIDNDNFKTFKINKL